MIIIRRLLLFLLILLIFLSSLLSLALPFVGLPSAVIFTIIYVKTVRKQKINNTYKKQPAADISSSPMCSADVVKRYKRTKSYSDCSCFFQEFNESYNSALGYEWFLVCVERIKFPQYNSIAQRLYNIRHTIGMTQVEASKLSGISPSTLSSYENGYTIPSDKILLSLASTYLIPFDFLKNGYVINFQEHVKLCHRYGEYSYLDSLIVSVRAASSIFVDMLTPEDKVVCVLVDKILNLNLDLFGEQAKANEELKNKIKSDILAQLTKMSIRQSDLYKSLGEDRHIAYDIVSDLVSSGVILKEKQGNTYVLSLIKTNEVCEKSSDINE